MPDIETITLVEVGVFGGGSLQMWRKFLGSRARIIGVDLNPACLELESLGFEIYLGDQSEPEFWKELFESIGPIDVLIDDGGHRYLQQALTLQHAIPNVRDGGFIAIEDCQTSYLDGFGDSKFSFVELAKRSIDDLNARATEVPMPSNFLGRNVASLGIYPGMVFFHIDSRQSGSETRPVRNTEFAQEIADFRDQHHVQRYSGAISLSRMVGSIPILGKLSKKVRRMLWRRLTNDTRELESTFRSLFSKRE